MLQNLKISPESCFVKLLLIALVHNLISPYSYRQLDNWGIRNDGVQMALTLIPAVILSLLMLHYADLLFAYLEIKRKVKRDEEEPTQSKPDL